MFGYTARRVKTRQTDTLSPPGESSQTHTETDGWYIDYPAWHGRGHYTGLYYNPAGTPLTRTPTGWLGERDEIRVTYEGRPKRVFRSR
jgi:hypothetical protein